MPGASRLLRVYPERTYGIKRKPLYRNDFKPVKGAEGGGANP